MTESQAKIAEIRKRLEKATRVRDEWKPSRDEQFREEAFTSAYDGNVEDDFPWLMDELIRRCGDEL